MHLWPPRWHSYATIDDQMAPISMVVKQKLGKIDGTTHTDVNRVII